MEEIITLERMAFRDANEAEPFGALDADPVRVLHGMNWLMAFWAVLWDLQSAEAADRMLTGLDYSGPWRTVDSPPRAWQAVTATVRSGILAALRSDPRSLGAYDAEVARLAPDLFLHISLSLMDGMCDDLSRRGLDLRGHAAALAENTRGEPTAGAGSFQRPAQARP
jgi:hypothetical protein